MWKLEKRKIEINAWLHIWWYNSCLTWKSISKKDFLISIPLSQQTATETWEKILFYNVQMHTADVTVCLPNILSLLVLALSLPSS